MLVWSSSGRAWAWGILLVCFGLIYAVPLAMIALASVSGEWNGALPSKLTLLHYAHAFSGDAAEQLRASIVTGAIASMVALVAGTWAALALRAELNVSRATHSAWIKRVQLVTETKQTSRTSRLTLPAPPSSEASPDF